MEEVLRLLHQIRPRVLENAVQTLTSEANLHQELRKQLGKFLDTLDICIRENQPSLIDAILMEWASAQTQTILEGQAEFFSQFLGKFMALFYTTGRAELKTDELLTLLDVVNPLWIYIFEKSAEFEINARLGIASEQLAKAQEAMHKLERSKSAFIAVAAHELRTPLTLIEGYTGMLNQILMSNSNIPNGEMLAEGIQQGTKRLHMTINDMITVSQIENNMLVLNYQPVWISRIFESLAAELEHTLESRKQVLEIMPFPGSNDMIFADPEKLMQVFRNILINAIKFTPDNGQISVDGRKFQGFIEVIIKDTGIGIPLEDQASIFEKFGGLGDVTLHSSGKDKFKGGGAGLGLNIAKGIVLAHEGVIWAESPGYDEENCPGSTFHVMLPHHTSFPDQVKK